VLVGLFGVGFLAFITTYGIELKNYLVNVFKKLGKSDIANKFQNIDDKTIKQAIEQVSNQAKNK